MSESTSSLTYQNLAAAVGRFLGYGGGGPLYGNSDPVWNTAKAALIDDCVRSGCRKVYSPIPPFDWSWLHPSARLELRPGVNSLLLPDDFCGLEGNVTITLPTGAAFPVLPVTNLAKVRSLFGQSATVNGAPQFCALEALKGTTAVSGQRYQLLVYPLADQDYTLAIQYYVVPDAPTAASPYVYGGPVHAETFLEACLAVAEQRQDDMTGLHTQLFAERLAASMAVDRRSRPRFLGRNGDTSDDVGYDARHDQQPRVSYNGVTII